MAGATMHRDVHGAEVYAMPGDRPPLTPEGARRYQQGVFAPALRARFVGGFYNETLTPQLAQQALPARYVDIDCDLYVSTVSVLRWCSTAHLPLGTTHTPSSPPIGSILPREN